MKRNDKRNLDSLLKLCEDFQKKVHIREVANDVNSLKFSCDLLLRNMIMIIEKEKNGESFTEEINYITNNLLGAHAHLTKEKADTTADKYNILYY
ncbi:hypothetical protein HPT25_22705 [Bacillus sp. BRMEA1]|uniref:hypothetical protein n=1 Tax=Neobacillus endophyticus TaxID=2738405 RepID=UPI001563406E|nr:hypothetical protein [Neobacillus endophyticus]NRD80151.1 hypothetical protein [Neobacillus endophyticus]